MSRDRAFSQPLLRGQRFKEVNGEIEKLGKLSEDLAQHDVLRSEFVSWLHIPPQQDWSWGQLANLCPFLDMKTRAGRDVLTAMLVNAKIVLCTLNKSASPFLQRKVNARTLFLDEGGQCSESEFFIATTYPSVKRIIVMGDPQQLPATVIDPQCKAYGFGKSWLSQICRLHPEKVHLLDMQYRMDTKILSFPNRMFYSDRIRSDASVRNRFPHVERPLLFIDTARKGSEEKDGFSWSNVFEANVIKTLLINDPDIQQLLKESTSGDSPRIMIITPYQAQARLIEEKIGAVKKLYVCDISISTVDSFQGQEADVVLLSTVRTRNPGFVDDPQRLNVALTRARRILRIVGDAKFFSTLPTASTLRQLAVYASDNQSCEETKISAIPWSRPNWDQPILWRPASSSRFHHCICKLPERKKNIAWNTLLTLAKGEEHELHAPVPSKNQPGWYISGIKCYHNEIRIVWIAKDNYRPSIEAVFAGTDRECRRFVQTHRPPADACIVRPGLRGILLHANNDGHRQEGRSGQLENTGSNGDHRAFVSSTSWVMNNGIQRLVLTGENYR